MATIRDLRLAKKWSQERLAAETRLSFTTVSRLERGLGVTEDNVKKICSALDVEPGDVEGIVYSNPLEAARKREERRRELKRLELA